MVQRKSRESDRASGFPIFTVLGVSTLSIVLIGAGGFFGARAIGVSVALDQGAISLIVGTQSVIGAVAVGLFALYGTLLSSSRTAAAALEVERRRVEGTLRLDSIRPVWDSVVSLYSDYVRLVGEARALLRPYSCLISFGAEDAISLRDFGASIDRVLERVDALADEFRVYSDEQTAAVIEEFRDALSVLSITIGTEVIGDPPAFLGPKAGQDIYSAYSDVVRAVRPESGKVLANFVRTFLPEVAK